MEGGEYKVIYDQIHEWLKKKYPEYFPSTKYEFVEIIISQKSQDYRLLTMEALALLNWMRKFADGFAKE
ncbi:type III-B CRISPR module-associated protein Cmr5 [Bacillus alveayuensis]|uniref:type III-B CRISPR module-associated protein Cmr5 n=1 Tax=Aeribacillus alveayuensis TaxID=279215 RepID=UPI0009FD7CA2|nr:type III-B CRISPR module-associated protein Cmr5 [Bacillus alveayuensis]